MRTRIISAIIAISFLVAAIFLFETLYINIILFLVVAIGFWELLGAYKLRENKALVLIFIIFDALVMFSDKVAYVPNFATMTALFTVAVLIYCAVRFPAVEVRDLGGVYIMAIMFSFGMYQLIALRSAYPQGQYFYDARLYMLLAFAMAILSDTFGYFIGSAFGKHKIVPELSPKKSVEGTVAGIVGTAICCPLILLAYVSIFKIGGVGAWEYIYTAAAGACGAVVGLCGDLVASMVKRQCGIKDYGTLIPGHGGVMDRFDSISFTLIFGAVLFIIRPIITR